MGKLMDGLLKMAATNQAAEEKTAGLLGDLMKKNKAAIGRAVPQRNQINPMQDALRKAKFDAYDEMVKNNLRKKAFFSDEEEEKTAVTKAEKVELRRMTGMAKRKVKKKKPNQTKESMYRMKKQKKLANFQDQELEKMASLMADQFIAATSLANVNPEAMDFETELIAGYKSFIDEVNSAE